MNFTNDEMNLMCIYNTGSRESLLNMTDSALQKLEKISDVEFAELELYPDF